MHKLGTSAKLVSGVGSLWDTQGATCCPGPARSPAGAGLGGPIRPGGSQQSSLEAAALSYLVLVQTRFPSPSPSPHLRSCVFCQVCEGRWGRKAWSLLSTVPGPIRGKQEGPVPAGIHVGTGVRAVGCQAGLGAFSVTPHGGAALCSVSLGHQQGLGGAVFWPSPSIPSPPTATCCRAHRPEVLGTTGYRWAWDSGLHRPA